MRAWFPSLLIALSISSIMQAQTRFIDGVSASIDPTAWTLSNNGWNFACKTKPALGTAGMVRPWLEAGSITLKIDAGSPVDASNMQKLYYEVMAGSNTSAPGVANPLVSRVTFRIKFDSSYTIHEAGGAPGGTGLYQNWQGSGWPPIQMRTDESTGVILVYMLMSNDDCRGSLNQNSSRIYTGTYEKNTWYSIDIIFKFGYAGGGYLKLWRDGELKVDWTGRIGYTPSASQDYASVEFGMYQEACGVNKVVHFDDFYYYGNYQATSVSTGNMHTRISGTNTKFGYSIDKSAVQFTAPKARQIEEAAVYSSSGLLLARLSPSKLRWEISSIKPGEYVCLVKSSKGIENFSDRIIVTITQ
jgi:hypothetical protein